MDEQGRPGQRQQRAGDALHLRQRTWTTCIRNVSFNSSFPWRGWRRGAREIAVNCPRCASPSNPTRRRRCRRLKHRWGLLRSRTITRLVAPIVMRQLSCANWGSAICAGRVGRGELSVARGSVTDRQVREKTLRCERYERCVNCRIRDAMGMVRPGTRWATGDVECVPIASELSQTVSHQARQARVTRGTQ